MGKEEYRFKLSDLMPNSWFYKLKEMRSGGKGRGSKGSKTQTSHNFMDKSQILKTEPFRTFTNQKRNPPSPSTPQQITNRPSYYIPTRDRAERLPLSPNHHKSTDIIFPVDTPRKSDKRQKKKPVNNSSNLISSVSSVFTCRNQSSSAQSSLPTISDRLHLPDEEFKDEFFLSGESLSSSDNLVSDLNPPLPPILTKPRLFAGRKQSPKQGNLLSSGSSKRSPFGSQQVKLRIKSPKLAMKIVNKKKKGLAESFVVVKSSSDPQRDFRESMVEMIVENNLRSLKEFEELLACYLSLNSSEYHDLIVKVFKQIWFDLSDLML